MEKELSAKLFMLLEQIQSKQSGIIVVNLFKILVI